MVSAPAPLLPPAGRCLSQSSLHVLRSLSSPALVINPLRPSLRTDSNTQASRSAASPAPAHDDPFCKHESAVLVAESSAPAVPSPVRTRHTSPPPQTAGTTPERSPEARLAPHARSASLPVPTDAGWRAGVPADGTSGGRGAGSPAEGGEDGQASSEVRRDGVERSGASGIGRVVDGEIEIVDLEALFGPIVRTWVRAVADKLCTWVSWARILRFVSGALALDALSVKSDNKHGSEEHGARN